MLNFVRHPHPGAPRGLPADLQIRRGTLAVPKRRGGLGCNSSVSALQLLCSSSRVVKRHLLVSFRGPHEKPPARIFVLPHYLHGPGAQMLELPEGQGCYAWLGVVGPGGPVLGPAVLFGSLGPPLDLHRRLKDSFLTSKKTSNFYSIFDGILTPKILQKASQNRSKIDQKDF